MILPLPVKAPAKEDSLRFIDLKTYSSFFDDLDNGFPFYQPMVSIGCGGPGDRELGVMKVGNYEASFVPSLSDFDRLDSRFRLPSKTWDLIPEYNSFSFAVFQLAAGSLEPHPMAFEFEMDKNELFFPTVHIHDGQVHRSETFDHVLYMQHASLDSVVYGYRNSGVEDRETGLIRSKKRANRFCDIEKASGLVDGDLLVHRKIIQGTAPNQDTIYPFTGDPLIPKINLRPFYAYFLLSLPLMAAGWLLARRSKLINRKDNSISKEKK